MCSCAIGCGLDFGQFEARDGGVRTVAPLSAGSVADIRPLVCGNAILEWKEACDDGNLVDDDGCSSACELSDDARTPGDDRAGVVSCTARDAAAPQACGAGLGCCFAPALGCSTAEACATAALLSNIPFNSFIACDGPEDCPAGVLCQAYPHGGTGCALTGGFTSRCHTDQDCPAQRPVCLPDGGCAIGL